MASKAAPPASSDRVVTIGGRDVTPVKVLPIRLSPELHEWVRVTAFNQRRSMAQVVLEALERYRRRVK